MSSDKRDDGQRKRNRILREKVTTIDQTTTTLYNKLSSDGLVIATPALHSLHEEFVTKLCIRKPQTSGRHLVHPKIPYNSQPSMVSPPTAGHCTDCKHTTDYHCYRLVVSPSEWLELDGFTRISNHDKDLCVFRGFLIISNHCLDELPDAHFNRFGRDIIISLHPYPLPKDKFVIHDLLLFHFYLFDQLLEVYDWFDISSEICFFPLFISERNHSLAPMSAVLKHLMSSYKNFYIKSPRSSSEERSLSRYYSGLIVHNLYQHPSALRIDRLEWSQQKGWGFVHFCHIMKTKDESNSFVDKELSDMQKTYTKLHQEAVRGELSRKNYFKLKQLKNELRTRKQNCSSSTKDEVLFLSCDGHMMTGIYADLMQHALLLPILFKHITYHQSLLSLEETLCYTYKDRSLLQISLTHPSYMNNHDPVSGCFGPLVVSFDHCGPYWRDQVTTPEGPSSSKRLKSGLEGLSEAVNSVNERDPIDDQSQETLYNERMEFLGDAVVELLTSYHLFHMFPEYSDGQLVIFRKALVCNENLAAVAERVNIEKYMLTTKCFELTSVEDRVHARANTLEALIGSVFLDGGLETVRAVLARLLFPEKDLYDTWMSIKPHPLKQQFPQGDRHLIAESELLQKFTTLEERVGVIFTNIRLLARAFTHPSFGYTSLLRGHYQRMEFLGDAILQFLTSIYVYKLFPYSNEGHLSTFRMAVVHNKPLASVSEELGLVEFIALGRDQVGHITEKIKADVVESFLAALYLDKGHLYAEKFCEVCLFPKLFEGSKGLQFLDPKSRLQHAIVYTCKKRGLEVKPPVYRLLSVSGPVHKRMSTVGVYFQGQRLAVGTGHNLQSAGMTAAEKALQNDIVSIPRTLQK